MANNQNTATAIALTPVAIDNTVKGLVAVAEMTPANGPAKHSWVSSAIFALLALGSTAAPVVEAANPLYAVAIDASIKSAVALYNAFGWPHQQQAQIITAPAAASAPTAAPQTMSSS